MKVTAKRMAVCSMLAALTVVLMLLGAIGEVGMYACPLLAGLCFIPVGQRYGRKYQWTLFAASALLCLMLVPSMEENLMFIGFFGWYPILRPTLDRLPGGIRWIVKLLVFNISVICVEWLVMSVLAPEAVEEPLLWVLLIMGNLVFWLYDRKMPLMELFLDRISKQLRF